MLVPGPKAPIVESADQRRRVAVLGSTGSIGTSTLEVLRKNGDQFEVFALTAARNKALLQQQVELFSPRFAALADRTAVELTKGGAAIFSSNGTSFITDPAEIVELAASPNLDIVVAAVVGFDCLPSVLTAIRANKQIALANKESVVCAGALLQQLLAKSSATIIPVDSEHSAIFQCLQGARFNEIAELTLTASGGPFLDLAPEQLRTITPEQATKHPRWKMGAKISVDSATMMNKALELIEAHWLFGVNPDKIKVLVHPQSIIHSLVSFSDGSVLAQLSVPDMKGPIAFALAYPKQRLGQIMPTLDLAQLASLEFRDLDPLRFPAINLARHCIEAGGGMSAVLNLANECAVELFMAGKITFDRIVPLVEEALSRWSGIKYSCFEDLLALRQEVQAGFI